MNSFQKSVKPKAVEELVDYYFYRRLANFLVPLFVRLRFSPNQVTSLSLITGLLASYLVFYRYFFWGTFVAIMAIIFDCCDGQVARLTGKTSPFGRGMDGLCDSIWISFLWIGLYHSQILQEAGYASIVGPMAIAGLSMVLHCWRFDGIKISYINQAMPHIAEQGVDSEYALQLLKQEIKKLNPFTSFVAFAIFFQSYFFVPKIKKEKKIYLDETSTRNIQNILDPEIRLWSFLGEGSHNTLFLFALCWVGIYPHAMVGMIFFFIIVLNLYWFILEIRWRRVEQKIKVYF
ncbi:MAG: hypothetical protein A3G32_05205 [Deltaproteobacteria bacterium RIFCSPLOWO2_12_FULL_40_28]|nr:MAG: hypothetical protein A3C45_09315 [Deltaproteobacteria bacterium RIFCSPHIGHO2_02_FULL_40_28]OGQ19759.1 MAG: hypothetical protein A3E27_08510 [Deltaproteobacteria bacterium RIFCSPHIGHO2_12_FULL_40_32]OGQ41036.1 MAG: hypothetical protein A3I69_03925 [Deltaproteobacteria bacterium RIFCSPLOWO2_02_FULL_40_36]OGQ54152.1 MAG: hypothetical protein A3G32_05205 [Deltaproteobacteria bacterium RIFCSPLOWO2_12_FULL_40_28]